MNNLALETAKTRLDTIRASLANGDTQITNDELRAAETEVSRLQSLQNNRPEPTPGVDRMRRGYEEINSEKEKK